MREEVREEELGRREGGLSRETLGRKGRVGREGSWERGEKPEKDDTERKRKRRGLRYR